MLTPLNELPKEISDSLHDNNLTSLDLYILNPRPNPKLYIKLTTDKVVKIVLQTKIGMPGPMSPHLQTVIILTYISLKIMERLKEMDKPCTFTTNVHCQSESIGHVLKKIVTMPPLVHKHTGSEYILSADNTIFTVIDNLNDRTL